MISDLRMGWKLLKYGYGLRQMMILEGVLFVLACLMYLTGSSQLGIVYWMVMGLTPTQTLRSLVTCAVMRSSPRGKRIQTAVCAAFNTCCFLGLYLTAVLIGILLSRALPGYQVTGGAFVMCGLIAVVMMVYCGSGYKLFKTTFVFYVVAWLGIAISIETLTGFFDSFFSLEISVLIGAVCCLAGGILQFLLSLLTYKLPESKMAHMQSLRKYM